jgi:hypothetical protein
MEAIENLEKIKERESHGNVQNLGPPGKICCTRSGADLLSFAGGVIPSKK